MNNREPINHIQDSGLCNICMDKGFALVALNFTGPWDRLSLIGGLKPAFDFYIRQTLYHFSLYHINKVFFWQFIGWQPFFRTKH
jgi:hypothetical protein